VRIYDAWVEEACINTLLDIVLNVPNAKLLEMSRYTCIREV